MDHVQVRPVSERQRSRSLDVLRGFALLGILVPNIWAFSGPMAAMTDPSVIGDTPANRLAHDITSTVFLGKFMFNFALLFGAGVVMYGRKYDHADEQGQYHTKLRTGWKLWYTRCAVLLGIGLVHAYLLWYGDILTFYALAGLTLVWWVRRIRPVPQFILGLALYVVGALLMIAFSFFGVWAYHAGHIELHELSAPIQPEIDAYTGSWLDALKMRAPIALTFQLMFGILFLPAAWGIMTMGMALTRSGFLTGDRSTRTYALWTLALLPLGLALTLVGYSTVHATADELPGFIWQSLAQFVGVPLAFGYTALVIAMSKTRALALPSAALANVGRMALTNYLLQTILCTTFFYGYGFGYFGSLEFPELWLVIASVWAINIILSVLWLRAFDFGPAEWLWRSLTYGRLVPIRSRPG